MTETDRLRAMSLAELSRKYHAAIATWGWNEPQTQAIANELTARDEEARRKDAELQIHRTTALSAFPHLRRGKSLAAENERLRKALAWIVDEIPKPGIYHGGETYFALNERIKEHARTALQEKANG